MSEQGFDCRRRRLLKTGLLADPRDEGGSSELHVLATILQGRLAWGSLWQP